jgi:hypothetical protein
MEAILQEIERALDAKLYYLAVAAALTVPGICAALESPTGATTGQDAASYKAWYNAHLAAKYPHLTDTDCYSLRCGVVHQGRFGHSNMQYERVAFVIPMGQRTYAHNNVAGDLLQLDAVTFCQDVIASVRGWFASKQNDATVKKNIPTLVQFRPNGLPSFQGLPLIA